MSGRPGGSADRALAVAEERANKAERALAKLEAKFQSVFYSDAVPMSFWSPDGRITEANDAYLRLVKATPDDLAAGRVRWDEFTLPEQRALDDRAMAELRSGMRSCTAYEKDYALKDGTRVPVLISGSLLPGRGLEDGGFAFALDLTEIRRASKVLREREAHLRMALDAARMVAWRWDLSTGEVALSQSAETVLGVRAAAFHVTELLAWMHPDDRAEHEARVARALAGDEGYRSEFRILRPDDGELMWLEDRGHVERDPRGERVAASGVLMDITERKRLEEERRLLLESERAARDEAERASRLKDDFVATLSHELRTPINAILGWARILRGRIAEQTTLERGLEVIERNARLQAEMVADLLDISRIVSGKLRLDVQRLDLAEVVQSAIESVRHAAEAKGVGLTARVERDVQALRGDPARLQQVVWNLLSNAVKFTPSGGGVRVVLRPAGAHVEVSVQDDGKGIEPAFLPHLFERFRQADSSSTRSFGGLGIGLSIVKQLVELHGGTVDASSAGAGEGATFTVRLPVQRAAPALDGAAPALDGAAPALDGAASALDGAAPALDGAASEGDGATAERCAAALEGVKVLLVDDQPDAREIAQRVLEECNAEVTTAGSAAEALALLAQRRHDVLVSDLGMPGEDGYQLIRRLRARGADDGGAVPAAALSALARPLDRARALEAGYQAHVAKPFDPAELVAVVARLATRGAR